MLRQYGHGFLFLAVGVIIFIILSCCIYAVESESESRSRSRSRSGFRSYTCHRSIVYPCKRDFEICLAANMERNGVNVNQCDEDEKPSVKGSTWATSLALVPYDETKILPHERPFREFEIANHKFDVAQDWQKLGVAAVVWDSAVVLGEYLHSHRHFVEGKKVLELGAGTGLVGMVAAVLGADVIVTERAEAMEHLTSTINNNSKNKPWKICAQVLDWTENSGVFPEVYDVILGADIIYIEDTFHDLLRTLKSLAIDDQTLILLSCRIRYARDLKFINMLKEFFTVQDIFFEDERKIKVFSVRRKL